MLITNVRIENFKRFGKLDIALRSFDCLVGTNNSGKTTLLQALALFDFCLHYCLSSKNGHIELKRRTVSPDEFYVIPISDPVELWTDRRTQERKKHKSITIALTFEDKPEVTATVDLNYNRFGISIECEDKSESWLRELDRIHISYLPVFSVFLPQEERRTPAAIRADLAQGQVSRVIRNLLLDLKDRTDGLKPLLDILRRGFPDLTDMEFEFDETHDRYIKVTYREKGHPRGFDVFSAGSGFHQFVYLFGFILIQQPTVILLDEPDVHLHGNLQQALLDELRRLVESGKQVIFATHSRELISRMAFENILSLTEKGVERLAVAFDKYDTLDRLGSLDATQLTVIQAYRRVLVVEDKSDHDLLWSFCERVLEASRWQRIQQRLAVCYAKGNPRKQDMPRLRQQLHQTMALRGETLQMFVVSDRDYHPDLQELKSGLPSSNLEWHIWERTEIENYLLCIDAIKRISGNTQPENQLTFIDREFENLIEASRKDANYRLVNAFQEYGREQKRGWDAATCARMADEYLEAHWKSEKLALADAKDSVLPGMKRWLQNQGFKQFSDKALAEALLPEELPQEIHDLAERLARFAGVA